MNVSGCCYSNSLMDSHRCVERAMHHNCPVCFEVDMFDQSNKFELQYWFVRDLISLFHLASTCLTRRRISAFCLAVTRYIWSAWRRWGSIPSKWSEKVISFSKHRSFHIIDLNALLCCRYSCPVCSRSVCDMSSVWKKLDQEVSYNFLKTIADLLAAFNFFFHMLNSVAQTCSGCFHTNAGNIS